MQELNLARERRELVVSLVQYIAHQLREFDYRSLGTLGVDVDKSVYVVERIHQEVRIDLILKVLQLPFEGVLLYLRYSLCSFLRPEVELHAEIHAHKQQSAEESHHLARSEHYKRSVFSH